MLLLSNVKNFFLAETLVCVPLEETSSRGTLFKSLRFFFTPSVAVKATIFIGFLDSFIFVTPHSLSTRHIFWVFLDHLDILLKKDNNSTLLIKRREKMANAPLRTAASESGDTS